MGHTPHLRSLLLVPVVAVVLAACGDDSPPAAAPEATETLPPVTSVGAPSHVYATGPDDVVIAVEYEGGFVPREMLFARTPVAMVTGDGRALTTGPVPAIYPGPLLPNLLERSITPEATQALLATADDLGLLADVIYERNDQIADAADTVVTITVDGATYRHAAYALGMDVEEDPARANLAEFVNAMVDLPGTVGEDQLGQEGPFAGEQYLLQAEPFDPRDVVGRRRADDRAVAGGRARAPRRCRRVRRRAGRPVRVSLRRRHDADVLHRRRRDVPRLRRPAISRPHLLIIAFPGHAGRVIPLPRLRSVARVGGRVLDAPRSRSAGASLRRT